MTLNKAIEHGKEKRKAFCRENGTRAKEISKVCRNHGGCEWCLDNRTHKYQKTDEAVAERMREYNDLGTSEEIT